MNDMSDFPKSGRMRHHTLTDKYVRLDPPRSIRGTAKCIGILVLVIQEDLF